MQKDFNKLPADKQRKFIVKNLLKDEYFKQFHMEIKTICVEDIYPKTQLKEFIKSRDNFVNEIITKLLRKYKDNVIDLCNFPTNTHYYNLALKQKSKLSNMINIQVLNYKDELGFMTKQLIMDTWTDTKNILTLEELSLESIVNNIHPFFDN
jgi:hypothetical protein